MTSILIIVYCFYYSRCISQDKYMKLSITHFTRKWNEQTRHMYISYVTKVDKLGTYLSLYVYVTVRMKSRHASCPTWSRLITNKVVYHDDDILPF